MRFAPGLRAHPVLPVAWRKAPEGERMLDLRPHDWRRATDVVDVTTATLGPWMTFAIAVVVAVVNVPFILDGTTFDSSQRAEAALATWRPRQAGLYWLRPD